MSCCGSKYRCALWFRVLAHAELVRGEVAAAERWAQGAACAASGDGPSGRSGFARLAYAEVRLDRDDAAAAQAACEAAASFGTARMPLYEATARIPAGSACRTRPQLGGACPARTGERTGERLRGVGPVGWADREQNRIATGDVRTMKA